MARVLIGGMCAMMAATSFGAAGDVLFKAPFTDANVWEKEKIYGSATVTREENRLLIAGMATNAEDTAWMVVSKRIPCAATGKYVFTCTLQSTGIRKNFAGTSDAWDTGIFWYDASGRQLARHEVPLVFVDGNPYTYRIVYAIPANAATLQVKLGWDGPNVGTSKRVAISDVACLQAGADEPIGGNLRDTSAPRIRIVSETPTRNVAAPVRVSVCDASGLDGASLRVVVDGVTRSDYRVVTQSANALELEIMSPTGGWSEGLHHLDITAADCEAHTNAAKKVFLIGDRPTTPAVTLREDGMTLIDGKPFFPIGIYAVCKRDFNAYDYDRAMSDLKAAGFNTVHSYNVPRDPEFLAAARKYDMKMWTAAYDVDKDVVNRLRHNPSIIAWYLGDDTAMHFTPETLYDRDDNMRAVDGTRITTQADVLNPRFRPDSYWDFVPTTDNYLPEIYPVLGADPKKDRACVAQTVCEMKRIAEDQKLNAGGRCHSAWPIIQYFKGWGCWKRFPTNDEFYGMNFAAIIHGAQGITWYTYGGFVNPEKKNFNYGVTSSEEVWRNTTNATRRIAALLPILTERTPAVQPPLPRVTKGPAEDALGGASVTCLLKEKDGVRYLLAVNAADAEVTAEFSPKATGPIEVMWEKRTVTPKVDGTFADSFRPLGVHIYRMTGRCAD